MLAMPSKLRARVKKYLFEHHVKKFKTGPWTMVMGVSEIDSVVRVRLGVGLYALP